MNSLAIARTLPVLIRSARTSPVVRAVSSNAAHNLPPALSRRPHDVLSPFSLNQMMREMDSMFPSVFGATDPMPKLAVDIEEKPEAFVIHADVPGMQSKDVKVHLSPDNVLSIEAERSHHTEDGKKGSKYYRVERTYGSLHRSFKVPDHVDVNAITADVKDGVLCVNLPKMESAPKHEVRTILVKDGGTESS